MFEEDTHCENENAEMYFISSGLLEIISKHQHLNTSHLREDRTMQGHRRSPSLGRRSISSSMHRAVSSFGIKEAVSAVEGTVHDAAHVVGGAVHGAASLTVSGVQGAVNAVGGTVQAVGGSMHKAAAASQASARAVSGMHDAVRVVGGTVHAVGGTMHKVAEQTGGTMHKAAEQFPVFAGAKQFEAFITSKSFIKRKEKEIERGDQEARAREGVVKLIAAG